MWLRLYRNGHWNDIFAAVSNAGEMEYAASVVTKLKTEEELSKGITFFAGILLDN